MASLPETTLPTRSHAPGRRAPRSAACRDRCRARRACQASGLRPQHRCPRQRGPWVVLCQRVETAPSEQQTHVVPQHTPQPLQPTQHSNGKSAHPRCAAKHRLLKVPACCCWRPGTREAELGAWGRLTDIPTKSEVMLVRTDGKSCSRELVEGEHTLPAAAVAAACCCDGCTDRACWLTQGPAQPLAASALPTPAASSSSWCGSSGRRGAPGALFTAALACWALPGSGAGP